MLPLGFLLSEHKLSICNINCSDLLDPILKLPWANSPCTVASHPPWKAKCLSVQVLFKLGSVLQVGKNLDILDLSLHDEAEEVRIEATRSMPLIVLWSGFGLLTHMFNRLEIFGQVTDEETKKIIPVSLGYLACLYGSCNGAGICESKCKLFLVMEGERKKFTADYLLQGFWCSKCDRKATHHRGFCSTTLGSIGAPCTVLLTDCDYARLQSLFFELLFDDASEEVQVACVGIIHRILLHGTVDILKETRSEWIKCFDFLLCHRKKAVREAFCLQISFFLDQPILDCLFLDGEFTNKTKEQKFMDKIKHALAGADDPLMFETLLEAAAEIMNAVNIQSQLFLFSLILLIDQLDNPHMTVRITASNLIKRSCYVHLKGGFDIILSKVFHIRNELYDYLSLRLASRPKMIEEFAASVLGFETEELVKGMIPVVLPKLVVTQDANDQAIIILYELAKYLKTDMVQLIVNWLPKVLAFALHRADERQLLSALQFYHEQTGSDNQEIFAAALPALLDELVCFTDEDDSEEIDKRYHQLEKALYGCFQA